MTGAAELMDINAFLAFSEAVEGDARHELLDGRIVTMASESALHARVKNAVLRVFEQEIAAKGLSCEAFPDGMAVRVDAGNVFEPDVTLRCGAPLADETVLIDDPFVVVEVASPSTQRIDVLVKLARYFRNPSIQHYLLIVPSSRKVIHHRRTDGGTIEATTHDRGTLILAPPGLELDCEALLPPRPAP